MDLYQAWFNLKEGVDDYEFAQHFRAYMERLKADGLIIRWRLARRKLGLGPGHMPEFQAVIETEGLAQLDEAFRVVSRRSGAHETLHHGVNSRVTDVFFTLYRDFPDPQREHGEELF